MMIRKDGSNKSPTSRITYSSSYYSGSQSDSGKSDDDESPDEDVKSKPKCGACGTFCSSLQHIDATNLQLNPLGAGIWDECTAMIINLHFDLENGGSAFLIVLFMTYMSFGYPAYLLETLMGQYSGRKPILMIRHLLPIFSVKRFLTRETEANTFKLFQGYSWPFNSNDVDPEFSKEKPVLITFSGFLMIACFLKLSDLAAGMKVVLRLLLLFLFGYTFNGYLRTNPQQLQENSIVYLPLRSTFAPKWEKIVDGRVWVQAIIFVVHSMELGTLVHPYLGSKTFFHYRTARDGVLLILVAITWNLIGAVGVLLWLGYVGINKSEMEASLKQLKGHYGIHVVFIMKHIQAELAQQVEGDVLFFCAIFYMIVGIAVCCNPRHHRKISSQRRTNRLDRSSELGSGTHFVTSSSFRSGFWSITLPVMGKKRLLAIMSVIVSTTEAVPIDTAENSETNVREGRQFGYPIGGGHAGSSANAFAASNSFGGGGLGLASSQASASASSGAGGFGFPYGK
ncbi:unnamed protein product [Orchesella dallaii]|uniref:Uncharacterized protein n=1 Tax=Orchesella dallaii TaxID=48710 RepID=A0ABP1QU80_9HEXA